MGSQTEERGAAELPPPPKGNSQPRDGVGVKGQVSLSLWAMVGAARPTFWGGPAQAHQHLICIPFMLSQHSQPPQKSLPARKKGSRPGSPPSRPPYSPPQREGQWGWGGGGGGVWLASPGCREPLCVRP